jgi:hypothetical protein
MGDYNSVQQYADQAFDQNMRYLGPQLEQGQDRMSQEMINAGIDPNSDQGQFRQDDLARRQNDAKNSASFNALQFGQGVQNQMNQQDFQRSGLAGEMQRALWGNQLGASGQGLAKYGMDQGFNLGQSGQDLGRYLGELSNTTANKGLDLQQYGMDQNFALGQSGQDLQRYGMDIGQQLGMGNLDLARQGQGYDQMMGLGNFDFMTNAYNNQQNQYNDQFLYGMMNGTGMPGIPQFNVGGNYGNQLGAANNNPGYLGRTSNIIGNVMPVPGA